MFKYLIKKFFILTFSLYIVISLTFLLMHIIPGDPFSEEDLIPQDVISSLRSHYGLDQPLHVQYFQYFKNIIEGDLGISFKYHGRTANQILKDAFPISFILGLEALCLAVFFGVLLGTFTALKQGGRKEQVIMFLTILWISIPSFILATLLQYVFAMKLGLLPIARWGTFQQTILPAVSLAALPTAVIIRLIRSKMVEVLQEDYILTARAKGLNTKEIILKHTLKNTCLPIVSYLGPLTANVLTGSFVVEKIFGIPGLGQWFVASVSNRDYTLIMSLTIFYSAFLMICVFIVDVIYSFLDPRITIANRNRF